MTREQENILTMWTTVDQTLDLFKEVWTKLKAFDNAVNTFRDIRLELDPEAGKQKKKTNGITMDKHQQRMKVTKLGLQMAANIEAYARNIKDMSLQMEATFKPTHLNRLRDDEFPVTISNIIKRAKGLVAQLTDYGTTAKSIDLLQEALNKYNEWIAAPRIATATKKTATKNIAGGMEDGEEQLIIMDRLLGNMEESSPTFTNTFKSARMIINVGGRGRNNEDKPDDSEK